MSNDAINWAFEQPVKEGPKFCLVTLADRADENGKAFPSNEDMAERMGCTIRSVQTYLNALQSANLVHRKKRVRYNGSQRSNLFTLNLTNAENFSEECENFSEPDKKTFPAKTKNTAKKSENSAPLEYPTGILEPSINPHEPSAADAARRRDDAEDAFLYFRDRHEAFGVGWPKNPSRWRSRILDCLDTIGGLDVWKATVRLAMQTPELRDDVGKHNYRADDGLQWFIWRCPEWAKLVQGPA